LSDLLQKVKERWALWAPSCKAE